MWRIILSIILGVLIPVSYIEILSLGDGIIPDNWADMKFYNQPAPGIVFAPVSLPIYFDIFTKEERILPFIFNTFWFRTLSFILFNWVLYGLIGYFILGRFKRFKKRTAFVSEFPPPPPEF